MKKRRFTETQIISILTEADAGSTVKDICRRHGISDATYYNWKSKYGGLEASDVKRMKASEDELSQYKRTYAELARENDALKDLIDDRLSTFINGRQPGSGKRHQVNVLRISVPAPGSGPAPAAGYIPGTF